MTPRTSSSVSWVHSSWLGFDTETTGVSPKLDRVVTAALVERSAGAPDRTTTWLADPGVPIPATASRVHGITTEHARTHGRPAREVLDELNDCLAAHLQKGRAVVVFNASYDLPLIEADSKRHGVRTLTERLGGEPTPILDPLVLDRALDRWRRGKRTLSHMAAHYGVPVPEDTHQAHVDSTLTLDLLAALLERYEQLREMSATQVHSFQRDAHAAWAESFERYLASKGRKTTIQTKWP